VRPGGSELTAGWSGLAGSAALHLLVLAALVWPLTFGQESVRLPVREVMLVDLTARAAEPEPACPEPQEGRGGVRAEAPPNRHHEGGPEREETVSLESRGRWRDYLVQIKRRLEQVSRVRLLRSSGDRRLDVSALEAVRRAGPFPPMPRGMDLARLHVKAGFCYRLASR
jgi:TonB family protein